MLEDFGEGSTAGRRRLGLSAVLSIVVFSTMTGAVFAASATVRRAMVHEELVQVEFAPPPAVQEPPPPPPPPPPAPSVQVQERPPARLGTPRPRIEAPTEIPDSLPTPREAPSRPPPDPFAPELEGDPNGARDGVGLVGASAPSAPSAAAAPAPEPRARPRGPVRVIEGTRPPEFDREEIARNFEIPPSVAGSGLAHIRVVVRVTVHEDGSIARVEVLRGHPLIPNENIIRAVERSHASPARMADGSPYAVIHTLPITLALTL